MIQILGREIDRFDVIQALGTDAAVEIANGRPVTLEEKGKVLDYVTRKESRLMSRMAPFFKGAEIILPEIEEKPAHIARPQLLDPDNE